jgi:hypothetical protein
MKVASLGLLGALAFAHDCTDDNAAAGGGAGASGEVWERVFATWSCTAEARPPITFEVQPVRWYCAVPLRQAVGVLSS